MGEQTEFALRVREKSAEARVSEEDVVRLAEFLERAEGWATASVIGAALGMNERRVRAVAAAAMPRVVSFPGSPGYCLWRFCPQPQILHGIEALESQGRDMIKRANLYRVAYHREYRGGTGNGA